MKDNDEDFVKATERIIKAWELVTAFYMALPERFRTT